SRSRSRGSSASRGGSSSRRGSGDQWAKRGGNDWDDDAGYDEPQAPLRSSARNRRRAPEEDEIDLERALVPNNGEMMPMMQTGAGVPALPGFPETDEEERALGIRRPVYIPATGEKRKKKLSSWRVMSGVLSVMLICVASCALAGFVGRSQIERVFQKPIQVIPTAASYDFSKVPVTPVATKGPAANFIQSATTSHAVDKRYVPVDVTSHFHAGDTVYVVAFVRGLPKDQKHTLTVEWYLGTLKLELPGTAQTSVVVDGSKNADLNVAFALNYPTPGLGSAKVFWDVDKVAKGQSTDPSLALTIYFAVGTAVSTATPGKGTPPAGTPTAAPAPTNTPKK
ncbi:MAG TPA: hypothetical protein VGP82_09575, partial [Ktedonobacterales bacterium]|nr:hypothetical protein [Ktedonobacterales bacterium]